jgi:signal transduction histidine kinase
MLNKKKIFLFWIKFANSEKLNIIRSSLTNLLSNAVKFTPENGIETRVKYLAKP